MFPKMKKKLLTISWYIFYTLILFEIFARIAYAVPYTDTRLSGLDELSWRRQWVEKQKKKEKPLYYFDDFDSTTGWFSKPSLRNKSSWKGKFLNTNANGLRGTREFSYNKPSDTTRIIMLGDSFTFGEEVSDNETYSHYLQERFPNTEIINMGIHGFGHDQMLVLLKKEGVKYNPDIVILGFLTEDMSRNLLNFRDYAKPKYVINGDKIQLTNSPVPTPEYLLKWDWMRPRIFDLWSFIKFTITKKNGSQIKQKEKITTHILQEFAATVQSIGATPVFVYLPYGTETMSLEQNLPGELFLSEMCKSIGVEHCLTSRSHFIAKVKEGATFRTEFHWLAPGHQTVAEAIGDYLIDKAFISSPKTKNGE
jgi:hypothetical protein